MEWGGEADREKKNSAMLIKEMCNGSRQAGKQANIE